MDIEKRIIVAAGNLFMKYGARSVTMDDIARELSVSKKTIYQYYKDKDEIVTLSSELHIEEEKKQFTEIFESSEDAIEEMFKISGCIRSTVSEINPSLLYDLQKYHKKAWDVYVAYKNQFIRASVINNLNKGIKQGYYRPEIDPEIIATYRVEQVQTAFDDKVYPRTKYNFTEVQMQLFDHFLRGLFTEKGRQLYKDYQLKNSDQK